MKNKTRYYVSHKNPLTWLMVLCMVCSAVTRIVFIGMKGTGETPYLWSQIILPIAAALPWKRRYRVSIVPGAEIPPEALLLPLIART